MSVDVVHTQNDVQLLLLGIRRGLALYVKDIQTKVDENFFSAHFDASVQQKMQMVTEILHEDAFGVTDFLGMVGYGYLFHGLDRHVPRQATMPDALLDKFEQGNRIGTDFTRSVYGVALCKLLEPVVEDLIPEIRRGLSTYMEELQHMVDEGFFGFDTDLHYQVQRLNHLVTDDDRFNVADFLGGAGYGNLCHRGDAGVAARYSAMPAALLDKFAQGNRICPQLMREIYCTPAKTILLLAHGHARAPLAPWQPPAQIDATGFRDEQSVVHGLKVFLNIIQLQAGNAYLPHETQKHVRTVDRKSVV